VPKRWGRLEVGHVEQARVDVVVDEGMWRPKQVADYLGMSVRWVYEAAASGKIPHRLIPGPGRRRAVRFVPSEVRAFVIVAGPKPSEAA
jgi:predicted DNA-binding transcriptional regulator AlpA